MADIQLVEMSASNALPQSPSKHQKQQAITLGSRMLSSTDKQKKLSQIVAVMRWILRNEMRTVKTKMQIHPMRILMMKIATCLEKS